MFSKLIEKRMNIIGQNGNEGEHYEDIQPKKGYELENNIATVVHRGPTYWDVKLKTGEKITIHKSEAKKYITQDQETSKRYM